MALVHGSATADATAGALHALIIGVGGYPFLSGGSAEKKLPDLHDFGNPGQLTSPPRSALAWVEAILDGRITWRLPIGSVDLLVSPAPTTDDPEFPAADYEVPTHNAIVTAFEGWRLRCDSHPDNVALFVFIGHGLQAVDTLVLPADFGERGSNPWPQAFNMTKTRKGFERNAAKTQLFVVDACRTMPMAVIESPDAGVPALAVPKTRQTVRWETDLTIYAASNGERAHGPHRAPSYLTQALLAGLRGGSARQHRNAWRVSTNSLAYSLSELMRIVGARHGQRVLPFNTGVEDWLVQVVEPTADLHVGCEPEAATASADLSWHHDKHPSRVREVRSAEQWVVQAVPAGFCRVEANFPEGDYESEPKPLFVDPPKVDQLIPVQPT
ncbi:caspase family protein [Dactylosporangium cerinum]|uniref:Caspase family protein n=1 Tax=Dactylosporangium cerinum TaxID=1434730 RepID=A0ABV9VZS7_9ACTN